MQGFQLDPITDTLNQVDEQEVMSAANSSQRLEPQAIGPFLRTVITPSESIEPNAVVHIALHSILRLTVGEGCVWAETSDQQAYLAAGPYANDYLADDARNRLLKVWSAG